MMEILVKFHMVLISKLGKDEWPAVKSGNSKIREPVLGNFKWPQNKLACSNKKKNSLFLYGI
jgi:hypothetical protein